MLATETRSVVGRWLQMESKSSGGKGDGAMVRVEIAPEGEQGEGDFIYTARVIDAWQLGKG